MRAEGPGQSALLMLDVIDVLGKRGVGYAVIGAMAAALHGLVRASLDAGIFERVTEVGIGGESVRIVGREDFIAMKVFAGGPKDLDDARAAISLDPKTLDLDLLRALACRFGRATVSGLEALLAERN